MKKLLAVLLATAALASVFAVSFHAESSAGADSYMVGDADGDGAITIMDATAIQRLLAGFIEDSDSMIALRGDSDGNGLDIMDATAIQRYLAELTVSVPIGTIVELPAPTVEPTDAPTEATTIAPTDAPTEAPTDVPTDAPTQAPTSPMPTSDPNELPFIPVG